jgi:tetratricopeptide (TPR) repeat protein
MTRPAETVAHRLLPVCLALFLGGVGPAVAADHRAVLDEGLREYRAALDCEDRDERINHFRRAEACFTQLVGNSSNDAATPGIRNADLFVNLGNAAMGAERLGPAILAFRRALALDPDHARARQNLLHARSLLPDWLPLPEAGMLDTFFAWTGRRSTAEIRLLAAICFAAAALLIAAGIRWRKPILRNFAILPAIAWLALVALTFSMGRSTQDDAVVIVPEVVAHAADSAHAPSRFSQPVPGGAEVTIIEHRDDWSHIRLADGRDGWVPSTSITTVTDGTGLAL